MAGGGEGVAAVALHHCARRQIVFDVRREVLQTHSRVHRSAQQLVHQRRGGLVRDPVHVIKDAGEGHLDNFHAVAPAQNFRIADQTLNAEGGLRARGQHQRARAAHHLAHPQQMQQRVQILSIHADIGFSAEGTAVGGEVDALVSVLQNDERLVIALQLRRAPAHGKEHVHTVDLRVDLIEHALRCYEVLAIARVNGGKHFDFRRHILQARLLCGEDPVEGGLLGLGRHVLAMTGAARALPEMGVVETADDRQDDQLFIHGSPHCFLPPDSHDSLIFSCFPR